MPSLRTDNGFDSDSPETDDRVRTGACVVFPSVCGSDGRILGHHYSDVLDDSSFLFWDVCGLGRGGLAARDLVAVIRRHELRIHHRAKAGAALAVQSRILRTGTRSVLLEHEILEIETKTLCATARGIHAFFALAEHRSAAIPRDIGVFLRARTRRRSARHDRTSEWSVARGDQCASEDSDWNVVSEGIVEADHCDYLGHLNARFHTRLFAEAANKVGDCAGSRGDSECREVLVDTGESRIRMYYDSEALKGTRYQVLFARANAERSDSVLDFRLVDQDRGITLSRCRWGMPKAADGAQSYRATRFGRREEGIEK